MTWPYDLTAEFYDEDMGRNNDGSDISWYTQLAEALPKGPILELGCGTGRVTLPLAQAGFHMFAADCSLPMLQVLVKKSATKGLTHRVTPLAMDMGNWGIATRMSERFSAVLCPFSAFTYLLTDEERVSMLAGVRSCLAPDGLLALDVFIPDARLDHRSDQTLMEDYSRRLPEQWRPAATLSRSKRVTRNARPGINRIHRQYTFSDEWGTVLKVVETDSYQRPYTPDQILATLSDAGFTELQVCGDFNAGVLAQSPAKTTAVVARYAR